MAGAHGLSAEDSHVTVETTLKALSQAGFVRQAAAAQSCEVVADTPTESDSRSRMAKLWSRKRRTAKPRFARARGTILDWHSTPKVAGVTRSRLTGLSGGLVSEQLSIDLNGNETRSTVQINASSASETRVVDMPDSVQNAVSVSTQGRLVVSTSPTGVTTVYGYDGLGRRNAVTDARTGTSETHYDAKGRVEYVQDAAGHKTSFGYEASTGRKNRETNALTKHSYFAYDARGQLIRTWGDVPYPVQYVYDQYGRRTEMHTYRVDAGWSSSTWPEAASGDITRWHYQESTGLLQSKEDAAGKAVTYTYGAAGRLATRTWARQKQGGGALRTTYGYDAATGELVGVDYNDNTPDVTYAYDRLGRQTTITDGTGARVFAYDATSLELQTETMDGITPAVLTRYYDPAGVKGRLVGVGLGANYAVGYGYGNTGQLQSVSWTANGSSDVATYARVPGSDLLAGYATQSGLATSYAYEAKRDLKTQVANRWRSTVVSQYDYAYDQVGRRASVKNSGAAFAAAAFTNWDYDERNQVTSSDRYLGTALTDTSNSVNPERRAFAYDPIGNRETSTAAGVQTSYTPNELNQYDSVGQQSPIYDDDGNLLNEGTKVLAYNAENQLKTVTVPGVSVSTYDYDYIGRRVRKSVDVLDGSSSDYVVTWMYDGWSAVQASKSVGGGAATVKNFVWGLDLSQRMQGAGGIGGLIAVVDQAGAANLFAYDGNGNVSELIAADGGGASAHYEYDAFGDAVLASGSAAAENQFRFSTKPHDPETGLYDFGHRPYSPGLGRWVNRDPIGETAFRQTNPGLWMLGTRRNELAARAELLLYAMSANNAINGFDILGLWSPDAHDALQQHAFKDLLKPMYVGTLEYAGRVFDKKSQAPTDSFKHGMRQDGQDPEEAKRLTFFFVEQTLDEAFRFARRSRCNDALWRFAEAMHPVMDRMSPAHTTPDGTPIEWPGGIQALSHSPFDWYGAETTRFITPEIYAALRAEMRTYYRSTFESEQCCSCRNEWELPKAGPRYDFILDVD